VEVILKKKIEKYADSKKRGGTTSFVGENGNGK